MSYEPKAGHLLRASCSALDVYEILGAGVDDNGTSTLDLKVLELSQIFHYADNGGEEGVGYRCAPLTSVELPEGIHLVLRGVQWKDVTDRIEDRAVVCIEINAPVGGCYRCAELFWVHASLDGKDPVKREGTSPTCP